MNCPYNAQHVVIPFSEACHPRGTEIDSHPVTVQFNKASIGAARDVTYCFAIGASPGQPESLENGSRDWMAASKEEGTMLNSTKSMKDRSCLVSLSHLLIPNHHGTPCNSTLADECQSCL